MHDTVMNNSTEGRFPLYLKTLGISIMIPGLVGVGANLLIILAIFRKGSSIAKNKCTNLLGSLAILDLLSSLHFVQGGLGMLLGWSWMNQIYCFFSQIPYVFCIHADSFLILLVGIDRWLSLQFPVPYSQLDRQIYTAIFLSLCGLLGLSNLVLGAIYASAEVVVPACSMPTALNSIAALYWNQSTLVIIGLVILSYIACYTRVWFGGLSLFPNQETAMREKRFLNSMLMVASLYCVCWLTPMLNVFILIWIKATPSVMLHGMFGLGPLAAVNFCYNFFVYFARSQDYRSEFLMLLGKKNVVIPMASAAGSRKSARKTVPKTDVALEEL